MSLSNPNKFVTEGRLAEFYTQILPYLGGMPDAICNKFSKSDLVSTTEKVIGCDALGRPVYQKLLSLALNGSTGQKTIKIDDNFRNLHKCFVIIYNDSDPKEAYVLPWVDKSTSFTNLESLFVETHGNNLVIKGFKTDWSNHTLYATVQYTKTTDAANSFKWGDENDYSTDEKIVGTWIDGSYVYQKTISTGSLSAPADNNIAHGISNLKYVINAVGCVTNNNINYLIPYVSGRSDQNDWTLTISQINATNVIVKTYNSGWSGITGYITLQYTKTT